MNRFKPPYRLLKEIGYRETKTLGMVGVPTGLRVRMELPTYPSKKFYRYIARAFIAAVNEQFAVKIAVLSRDDFYFVEAFLNYIILAVLHNAAKYGNQNNPQKKITMTWWLGKKGVLVGVRDEGDFFLRASVKKAIESKKRFSTGKDPSDFDIIYKADIVSVFGGVLYVTILTDSLISPKD